MKQPMTVGATPRVALVCTDGSPTSTRALRGARPFLAGHDRIAVATVVEPATPVEPIAGVDAIVPTASLQYALATDQRRQRDRRQHRAQELLQRTCRQLDLVGAEVFVLHAWHAAVALSELALSLPAAVAVVGSGRCRGSTLDPWTAGVFDDLVRRARCPVIVCAV